MDHPSVPLTHPKPARQPWTPPTLCDLTIADTTRSGLTPSAVESAETEADFVFLASG